MNWARKDPSFEKEFCCADILGKTRNDSNPSNDKPVGPRDLRLSCLP